MDSVIKLSNGRYAKNCPSCGEQQTYLRKCYASLSLKLKKVCKKCSNRQTDNCCRGFYKDIRLSWFHKIKVSAETRGLEFNITEKDLWDLYEKQNKKCALTGWDIGWAKVGTRHTASVDRIDNSKGYLKDNIQLVDKDINMMKYKFGNQHFVNVCRAVTEYNDKTKW